MNLSEAESVLLNIKNEKPKVLKEAISYLVAEGKTSLVEKIVRNKNFRPTDVADQEKVFEFISTIKHLDPHIKVFSVIAQAYKALEVLDINKCKSLIIKMNELISHIESLPRGNEIKADSLHLMYSIACVRYHLYLFIGDIEGFLKSCSEVCIYFKLLDKSSLNKAFYQTCGNVYRCFVVDYISSFMEGSLLKIHDRMSWAKNSLILGMVNSDEHPIKFDEYLEYVDSYSELKSFNVFAVRFLNDTGASIKPEINKLLLSILRKYGEQSTKKNDLIVENFLDYYNSKYIIKEK